MLINQYESPSVREVLSIGQSSIKRHNKIRDLIRLSVKKESFSQFHSQSIDFTVSKSVNQQHNKPQERRAACRSRNSQTIRESVSRGDP